MDYGTTSTEWFSKLSFPQQIQKKQQDLDTSLLKLNRYQDYLPIAPNSTFLQEERPREFKHVSLWFIGSSWC